MVKTVVQAETMRKWNFWLSGLYAAQAVAILLFANAKSIPVNLSFLNTDSIQTKITGQTVTAPAVHHLFDARLAYLIAAMLVVGAVARLLMATAYRRRYEADLKEGLNRLRWIEFAISSGLMLIIIALLAGMTDLASLIMLWGLLAVAGLSCLVMEVHNPWRRDMRVKWLSFVVALKAGFVPWLVVAIYLVATNVYANQHIPTYLHILYDTILVCFAAVMVNMYLQYRRRGRWGDYYFSERVYAVLGLVTASLLAWQVFAGVLK